MSDGDHVNDDDPSVLDPGLWPLGVPLPQPGRHTRGDPLELPELPDEVSADQPEAVVAVAPLVSTSRVLGARATLAILAMSDDALLRRLTPLCTCDGVTCADEGCAGCSQLDPEWGCLRACTCTCVEEHVCGREDTGVCSRCSPTLQGIAEGLELYLAEHADDPDDDVEFDTDEATFDTMMAEAEPATIHEGHVDGND